MVNLLALCAMISSIIWDHSELSVVAPWAGYESKVGNSFTSEDVCIFDFSNKQNHYIPGVQRLSICDGIRYGAFKSDLPIVLWRKGYSAPGLEFRQFEALRERLSATIKVVANSEISSRRLPKILEDDNEVRIKLIGVIIKRNVSYVDIGAHLMPAHYSSIIDSRNGRLVGKPCQIQSNQQQTRTNGNENIGEPSRISHFLGDFVHFLRCDVRAWGDAVGLDFRLVGVAYFYLMAIGIAHAYNPFKELYDDFSYSMDRTYVAPKYSRHIGLFAACVGLLLGIMSFTVSGGM